MVLDDKRGSRFAVHFYHGLDANTGRRFTSATMHLVPCANPKVRPCGTMDAVTGVATCSPVDNFVYSLGRITALTRAMDLAQLSDEQRKELWADFFAKSPNFLPARGARSRATAKARKIEAEKQAKRIYAQSKTRAFARLMQAMSILIEEAD